MPQRSPHRPVFDPRIRKGQITTGSAIGTRRTNVNASTVTLLISIPTPTVTATDFDPVNDVNWNHVWWVEGPEFGALGLSNGSAVATWPDEVGTADLTQSDSTKKPTYNTSGTGFSLPAVDFDGTLDVLGPVSFSSFGAPHTVVAIAYNDFTSPATAKYIFDGFDSTHRLACGIRENNEWRHFSGSLASGGSATIAKHSVYSFIDSDTDDTLFVDGSNQTGASAGNQAMNGLTMGGSFAGDANWDGRIVWVSTYDGAAANDSGWTGFVAWASSYYGVTF